MKIIKNIRIWLPRILLLVLILVFTGNISFSQVPTAPSDTTAVSQNQEQSGNANQEQVRQQNQSQNQGEDQNQARNQNQGSAKNNSNTKAVKQVKSAKPDMSKARGARPNIVRPSGSNVPKGAGKPGGVKRIGGR
jgi:hypothetical protein